MALRLCMKTLVGGRCPPAPPAPAFGKWGPCPIYLCWNWNRLYIKINMRGTSSPSNSPCPSDILTLPERVTF